MSINGIRKIRDAKHQDGDFEKMRFQRLSEFTDSVYISTYEGVSTGYGNKSEQKKSGAIGSFNSTQSRQPEKHRKTGSVVLPSEKQRSIADFVNRELHLPVSSYKFKQRDRPSNTGSLTSRKQRETPLFQRPLTKIDTDRRMTTQQEIGKASFHLDYVVGKGGFGKVWRVKQKKSGLAFAMKEMLKAKIIKKRSVHSVMNEKELLERLSHPFLVNMVYAFQDMENLYLVMDYVNGGDLRYHMGSRRRFTESECKFIAACIIVALQYLHNNGIIHRDLKPENLVFDKQGFLRLTDLGVSRVSKPANAADTSGTPGYMSPQVICRRDHTFPVDFFALGVIIYEIIIGKRPYVGKNRAEIRDQILSKQAKIDDQPKGWSPMAVDFVNRLIQRKPESRLGANGINELKDHQWFRGFDWSGLVKRTIKPPFVPLTIEEDYDTYKRCISSDSELEEDYEAKLLLRKPETQEMFEGYQFKSEKGRRRL